MRGDHWPAAGGGDRGVEALLAWARCCSLSARCVGGCLGAAAVGLRRTSVRSITKPPLPTRWMR